MTSPQEKRWWLCVQYLSAEPMRVERFETQEQAELYAVMTDGYVVVPYTTHDILYNDILYDYYLAFSERTE